MAVIGTMRSGVPGRVAAAGTSGICTITLRLRRCCAARTAQAHCPYHPVKLDTNRQTDCAGRMPKKDPRVDAYIAGSADFAKPILKHLRRIVHAAAPGVEETMKWSFPHFMHKGILCGMGAFKEHCTFG